MTSWNRTSSLIGMLLAADGVAFLTNPHGQIRVWSSPRAPTWYRRSLQYFDAHPALCRTLAAVELAAGVAILSRIGKGS